MLRSIVRMTLGSFGYSAHHLLDTTVIFTLIDLRSMCDNDLKCLFDTND